MFIVLCIVFSCCGSGGADWANVAWKCNWWNVTYLLDVVPSNPLPLSPPPIPLHMLFKVRIWLLSNIHKCCIISNTHTQHGHMNTYLHGHAHTHTHTQSAECPEGSGGNCTERWVSVCVSVWMWGKKRDACLCGCEGRRGTRVYVGVRGEEGRVSVWVWRETCNARVTSWICPYKDNDATVQVSVSIYGHN